MTADISLRPVTRENWLEALNLQVKEQQVGFVPPAAVSLAKVYIKPDGDLVEYEPFAIYAGSQLVGFVMLAYEEGTNDMYWLNGFLIDARHQYKGYGRAALHRMIQLIRSRFAGCTEIRLSVHPDNRHALKLYASTGFIPTSQMSGREQVYRLPLDVCARGEQKP
ncbi:GNAT family N-acetyltransferase [Paenibacillus sp. S-38]|uniref:GNAT family N-acetyltransferase n=1 Tax=Paenibacillus sp. S-38 TaxID=3416710 RepID=UPI003CF8DBDB